MNENRKPSSPWSTEPAAQDEFSSTGVFGAPPSFSPAPAPASPFADDPWRDLGSPAVGAMQEPVVHRVPMKDDPMTGPVNLLELLRAISQPQAPASPAQPPAAAFPPQAPNPFAAVPAPAADPSYFTPGVPQSRNPLEASPSQGFSQLIQSLHGQPSTPAADRFTAPPTPFEPFKPEPPRSAPTPPPTPAPPQQRYASAATVFEPARPAPPAERYASAPTVFEPAKPAPTKPAPSGDRYSAPPTVFEPIRNPAPAQSQSVAPTVVERLPTFAGDGPGFTSLLQTLNPGAIPPAPAAPQPLPSQPQAVGRSFTQQPEQGGGAGFTALLQGVGGTPANPAPRGTSLDASTQWPAPTVHPVAFPPAPAQKTPGTFSRFLTSMDFDGPSTPAATAEPVRLPSAAPAAEPAPAATSAASSAKDPSFSQLISLGGQPAAVPSPSWQQESRTPLGVSSRPVNDDFLKATNPPSMPFFDRTPVSQPPPEATPAGGGGVTQLLRILDGPTVAPAAPVAGPGAGSTTLYSMLDAAGPAPAVSPFPPAAAPQTPRDEFARSFESTPIAQAGPGEMTRMINASQFREMERQQRSGMAPAPAPQPPAPAAAPQWPGMPQAPQMPAAPQMPQYGVPPQYAPPAYQAPAMPAYQPPAVPTVPTPPAAPAPANKLQQMTPLLLIFIAFLLVVILITLVFLMKH